MATASEKNGYKGTPLLIRDEDVKVLVVGDRKCGKTKFIKAFLNKHEPWERSEEDGAVVYQCKYKLMRRESKVFICELDGSDEGAEIYLKCHSETNSFVLMYAIDDPLSFEQLRPKWIDRIVENRMFQRSETAIVVGNKADLRENPEVIQRLAQNGQAPITIEQGKSKIDGQRIRKYFDCSSVEPLVNVLEAFDFVLSIGYMDAIGEQQGYHLAGLNQEVPEDT